MQNQTPVFETDRFQNNFDQQIPVCNPSNDLPTTTSISNRTPFMQGNMRQFSTNSENFEWPIISRFCGNFLLWGFLVNTERFIRKKKIRSLNSGSYSSHNFSFDSVSSTPLSSPTPLNSSSTYINGNTEDERSRKLLQ